MQDLFTLVLDWGWTLMIWAAALVIFIAFIQNRSRAQQRKRAVEDAILSPKPQATPRIKPMPLPKNMK